jgi:uncharacterized GH25 family protein
MKRFVVLLALVFPSAVYAHDTWIAPDRFDRTCGAVTLHMTSGQDFDRVETTIDPARVTRAYAHLPGQRVAIKGVPTKYSLDFTVKMPKKGLTIVGVDLAPKTLELTSEEVDEYLDEIGAAEEIRAYRKLHPGRWRERYTKHAKTFLRCGAPSPSDDFQLQAGMGLELIPQGTDPTTLKAGDTFRVILVAPKKPLFRTIALALVRQGAGQVATIEPDAHGIVSVVLKEPGHYLLSATDLRHAEEKDLDWESDFTTLTFDVKP